MFKKVLILLSAVVVIASLTAQETQLKQYQTFSWTPVANARQYEISVEKNQEDGSWQPEASETTKQNRLEMLLYPGKYRVSISAYNVFNKKASESPWVSFIILDEKEPFIFNDMFEGGSTIRVGTLHTVASAGTENADGANENYPPNSIQVKGKNIFFAETTFALVPAIPDDSLHGAILSYTEDRAEVPLPIIARDRDQNEVIVTYDESKLYTGCYKLEVRNPGNMTMSIAVNIITSRAPEIDDTNFSYDNRYKVHTAELVRSSDSRLLVNARDCSSATSFSLVPAEGIPYPFASIGKRTVVPLTVDSFSPSGTEGLTSFAFAYKADQIDTGYYLFTMSTPGTDDVTELLLITVVPPPEVEQPKIMTLKSKYNKKLQTLEFTVGGTQLDSDAKAVLISECSQEDGTNVRRQLTLKDFGDNKKKIILNIVSEGLDAGTYALLVETGGCQAVCYVTIDAKYKSKLEDIPPEKSDELFLRPEELEVPEEMQVATVSSASARFPLDSDHWWTSAIHIIQKDASRQDYEANHSDFLSEIGTDGAQIAYLSAALNYGDVPDGWYTEEIQFCTTDVHDLQTLTTGDSIRFKVTDAKGYRNWRLEFVCRDGDGKESVYFIPFKYAEKHTDETGTYYMIDGRYEDLWDTTWNFKSQKPFNPENVKSMSFYANVTRSSTKLAISDFEIYDSSTIPTKLVHKRPVLCTRGQALATMTAWTEGSSPVAFTAGGRITLLDFSWLSQEISGTYGITDQQFNFDTSLKLCMPWKGFTPYVGAGFGITLPQNFSAISEYYVPAYAGATLFRVLDFRYTCKLHDILSPYGKAAMYFEDQYTVGVTVWLRSPGLKRVPKEAQK